MSFRNLINVLGGEGSGNFGHAGIPGHQGGSGPGGAEEARDSFRSALLKETRGGKVPLYHEAPLAAFRSILKNGLTSTDSVEDTNFATVGESSGFVKGDKVIVRFQVPKSDLDLIAPDMRYGSESELIEEHGGAHGADVAYNGPVPLSMIDQIQVVRDDKVLKTIRPKTNSLRILNVEKRGGSYCVVHAHPQKKGSQTDQPAGTAIHCYSIDEFGEAEARKKANAMHYAITISEMKSNDGTPEGAIKGWETRRGGASTEKESVDVSNLSRGDYINSTQGEGYILAKLPTGEYQFSMSKSAKEGRRVSPSEINKVMPKGTFKWLPKANEAPIPSINALGSSVGASKAILKGKPYPGSLKGVKGCING